MSVKNCQVTSLASLESVPILDVGKMKRTGRQRKGTGLNNILGGKGTSRGEVTPGRSKKGRNHQSNPMFGHDEERVVLPGGGADFLDRGQKKL